MATVDIIIPLYNKQQTVARTVRSVLDQTWTDWRLIIVDDGSTDDSRAVVQTFADPRIVLLTQDNCGPGAARNRGIAAVEADFVAFLDADDQWHPWYLENAIAALRKNTEADLVGSLYEEWPERTDMTAVWAAKGVVPGVYAFRGDEHPRDVLSFLFFFHVGNTVVRTAAARDCGGFYDRSKCLLGEDTVFFAKLVLCRRFAIIGPTAVRHNRQDSGLSNRTGRPVDIFLREPDCVTAHCPEQKRPFVMRVLAWHALRTAHYRVRRGQKSDALQLRQQYPGMRQWRLFYAYLCAEILLSRWLVHWVTFKCRVGPPVRRFLSRAAGVLRGTDNRKG